MSEPKPKANEENKVDKTEKVLPLINDMKTRRANGKIVLYFDGKGNIREIEVTEKH